MTRSYTAKYTKIDSGYMGQLVEWPEVVTEGSDIEECRSSLRDALQEMVLAYRELGREIPTGNALFEQVSRGCARSSSPSSFLLTAQTLNLEGPPDWSMRLREYLYGSDEGLEPRR